MMWRTYCSTLSQLRRRNFNFLACHLPVVLWSQVDDSTMPLLGNTKEDDMRIIAEMTINKLQTCCRPTPSAIIRLQRLRVAVPV
jgi:hypothetical protein